MAPSYVRGVQDAAVFYSRECIRVSPYVQLGVSFLLWLLLSMSLGVALLGAYVCSGGLAYGPSTTPMGLVFSPFGSSGCSLFGHSGGFLLTVTRREQV